MVLGFISKVSTIFLPMEGSSWRDLYTEELAGGFIFSVFSTRAGDVFRGLLRRAFSQLVPNDTSVAASSPDLPCLGSWIDIRAP